VLRFLWPWPAEDVGLRRRLGTECPHLLYQSWLCLTLVRVIMEFSTLSDSMSYRRQGDAQAIGDNRESLASHE
jgi:hypothetical protein